MEKCRLLFVAAVLVSTSGIYVDEPLIYDYFPDDFMWAAATSAHQVEGGWTADGASTKFFIQLSSSYPSSNLLEIYFSSSYENFYFPSLRQVRD